LIYLAIILSCLGKLYDLKLIDVYVYYIAVFFAMFSLISYFNFFYKNGYLPNKEEIKKSIKNKS
jgi:hypothetical protein